MTNVPVVIDLPEELVKRAEELGLPLEPQFVPFAETLATAIRRREAALRLRAAAERARALPDNEKPTPEEIDAEFEAYWSDKSDQ